MNFKILAIRKNNALAPFERSVIGLQQDPKKALEDLVLKAQLEVQQEKELRKTTFFDMIPDEYKAHVEMITEKAFTERKITHMSYEDFRELIAQNWLIKRKVFVRIATDFGARQVARFPKHADTAAFILTSSASFVVVSKPDRSSVRSILYMRIAEREPVKIPAAQMSNLRHDVAIGERVKAALLNSSPAMDILVNPDADLGRMRDFSESVSHSFHTVDHHTIHFGPWNRNGGNDELPN